VALSWSCFGGKRKTETLLPARALTAAVPAPGWSCVGSRRWRN